MLHPTHQRRSPRRLRRGFTLVEMLIVVFLIAVLISILIPVVSKVREAGYKTNSTAFLRQLEGAIESYHTEYHAFPGPVPNNECGYGPANNQDIIYSTATGRGLNRNMMGSENLVLGLLGGLWWNPSQTRFEFDIQRTLAAKGPSTLNQLGMPTVHAAFIEAKNIYTSEDPNFAGKITGIYRDEAGWAQNTEIPEFVDSFPQGMPILYMRANVGVATPAPPYNANSNPIITPAGTNPPMTPAQYDLRHIIGYTSNLGPQGRYIGEGKKLPRGGYKGGPVPPAHGLTTVDPKASMDKTSASYVYPYDAYPYFTNPNTPNTARNKDGYILISAGADRIYGTEDDICNFGSVLP